MSTKRYISTIFLTTAFASLLVVNSCKKEDPAPPNPYDSINYGGNSPTKDTVDPSSFLGIYKNILQPKCAVPGCHTGNFPPDFRSPQAAYSTLLYEKIVKNDLSNKYSYRVVPFDTGMSVLYQRITNCCFVNQDDRMPQDNIGNPLPENGSDISNISKWIMNGAPDFAGTKPSKPDTMAHVLFYYAANSDFTVAYSTDSNRIDSFVFNPFYAPANSIMNIAFFVTDDVTPVKNFKVNKLKLSLDKNDFSNPIAQYNATYIYVPPPENIELWYATLNTASLPKDTIIYMRYYVNDGQNPTDSEMPNSGSPFYYKTIWAFYNPK